jgi:hypothetical protein
MAIKINFVLFERTFKVLYEDSIFTTFSHLAWFSKYFDQKQCAVRHLGILIYLIDDVTSRVNLLKRLHVGLNFFERFLKML